MEKDSVNMTRIILYGRHKKGLLQNAVFRPKREICALKKLVRTAALTVLTNFFL